MSAPDPFTPEQRALRARLAAFTRWGNTENTSAATAPARRAFLDRFDREADPTGTLPAAERARRAAQLRKAYFARLALQSSRARSARKPPHDREAA